MTDRMGLTEFFAMEAGDYLERLDALVSPPTPPDPDELLRLTRALRGSALMAKQSGVAVAAEAFEQFARAVKERRRPWDEATKQLAVRAVDDFKILIRQVGTWSEREDARAHELAEMLSPGGTAAAPAAAGVSEGLDVGTRAFIGREGAAVASALDQAAKSLQRSPRVLDPVRRVASAMQPLRGLAILAELPPMSELLDGVEQAVSEIMRSPDPIPDAALLLNAAAHAVARATKELAHDGKAEPDAPEVQDFAQRLQRLVAAEAGIVPIESLFYEDDGPHVVEPGNVTAPRRVLGRVELVSHGEHLRQAAHEIERALSRTQLELRAQALVATFRALSSTSGSPLNLAVSRFAIAAREAVLRGAPVRETPEFVRHLRDAGSTLAETGHHDDTELATRLEETAKALAALAERRTPEPIVVEEPETTPPVAIEPAAPEPEPEPVAEIAEAPIALETETADLIGSWARYQRYADQLGLEPPSLDELLAGPPADPGLAVAEEPEPVVAEPEPVVAEPEPIAAAAVEEELVPITDLCYSGPAALERAKSLRAEIQEGLAAEAPSADLRELIEEVLDLVELGLAT